MDLVMPEEGGLDAIFDIRQTNPRAKFIVLTSTARKVPELLAEVEKALENAAAS